MTATPTPTGPPTWGTPPPADRQGHRGRGGLMAVILNRTDLIVWAIVILLALRAGLLLAEIL